MIFNIMTSRFGKADIHKRIYTLIDTHVHLGVYIYTCIHFCVCVFIYSVCLSHF